MPYKHQKAIQLELDTRIPRGLRGGSQNELRFRFYFYRSQGLPFDTSLTRAVLGVRERDPNFVPRVLPVPA
jgi:hypothetical protein